MPLKSNWVGGEQFFADDQNDVAEAVNAVVAVKTLNVKDFGAVGDGSTNDTTAFAAAITEAQSQLSGFGAGFEYITVMVPTGRYRLGALSIPSNVWLEGDGARLQPTSAFTGTMLTLTGSYAGIRNFRLYGNEEPNAEAIHINTGTFHNTVIGCQIDHWGGRAILNAGGSTRLNRLYVEGMRNTTTANALSTYTGVVELTGGDAWITDCEFSAARYSPDPLYELGATTNMRACALRVDGGNTMLIDVVCEQGDHGIYISNTSWNNSFVGVRGEVNYGHGWLVDGASWQTSRLVNCLAWGNSKDADNTFDGFHINSGDYVLTNCVTDSNAFADSIGQRYGFYQGSSSTATYANCRSVNNGTMNDHVVYYDAATSTAYTKVPERPNIRHIYDANGNNMLGFDMGASAVNYVVLQNAASTGPGFYSQGPGSDIDLWLSAKGNGALKTWIPSVADANLYALGGATDVGWNLLTQGAALVKANSLPVDAERFITLTSAYTLTSTTAAQRLFNASATGAVTLPVGTYFFDCYFDLSSMSASSGTFGFALGGAATFTQKWQSVANKAAVTTAAAPLATAGNTGANTNIIGTGNANTVGWARVTGKLRVSVAGTVIPQVNLGVAAAAVVGVDSYFRVWQVGSNTVTTAGTWS